MGVDTWIELLRETFVPKMGSCVSDGCRDSDDGHGRSKRYREEANNDKAAHPCSALQVQAMMLA